MGCNDLAGAVPPMCFFCTSGRFIWALTSCVFRLVKMGPIPSYDSEAMGQEKVALRKLAEEEAGEIISDVLEKVLESETIRVEMRRMWIGESLFV